MTSRVLVVDDAAEIRLLVALALEERGLTVTHAVDGRAGLAAAVEDPPDAVVLDVQLPLLPGPEVLRRLAEHPRTAHVPVLVLTGSDASGDAALLALGAARVLRKPFDLDVLASAVTQVVDAPRATASLLEGLWSSVAHVARARVLLLEQALDASRAGLPGAAALRAAAFEECHKLVGSLDSYGRVGGSDLALSAAGLLEEGTDLDALAAAVGGLRALVG